MGAGIEEKRRQADCYRAVDEPEGLDLEERRVKNRGLPVCFPGLVVSVAGLADGSPGNACQSWGLL